MKSQRRGSHDGISALTRRGLRAFSLLSLPFLGAHSEKSAICRPGRRLSPQCGPAGHPNLGHPAPERWEINFHCWCHPIEGILWEQAEPTKTQLRYVTTKTTVIIESPFISASSNRPDTESFTGTRPVNPLETNGPSFFPSLYYEETEI